MQGHNDAQVQHERAAMAWQIAENAIDGALSAYWADSFDVDELQAELSRVVYRFTRNAKPLSEPNPNPEIDADTLQEDMSDAA